MVAGIVGFIAWLVFCAAVATWAEKKGHKGVGYFFLSMFLSPLVGVVVVACIADNTKKKCPFCNEKIDIYAKICPKCGKTLIKTTPKPVNTEEVEKNKWVSARIVELISAGKSATDAKIQAEAEYAVNQNKASEPKSEMPKTEEAKAEEPKKEETQNSGTN